jgi:hypothetical protein
MPQTHNTMTGNLTGHELERRVAKLINCDALDALVIREQVKILATMTDEDWSDEERAVAHNLIGCALYVGLWAETNGDVTRFITKLLSFIRQNGM